MAVFSRVFRAALYAAEKGYSRFLIEKTLERNFPSLGAENRRRMAADAYYAVSSMDRLTRETIGSISDVAHWQGRGDDFVYQITVQGTGDAGPFHHTFRVFGNRFTTRDELLSYALSELEFLRERGQTMAGGRRDDAEYVPEMIFFDWALPISYFR